MSYSGRCSFQFFTANRKCGSLLSGCCWSPAFWKRCNCGIRSGWKRFEKHFRAAPCSVHHFPGWILCIMVSALSFPLYCFTGFGKKAIKYFYKACLNAVSYSDHTCPIYPTLLKLNIQNPLYRSVAVSSNCAGTSVVCVSIFQTKQIGMLE